ncbi:hypothetical protein RchiOBHm_Chr2g0150461 [Rosa chinensis]|uniref:Uncharacterized protein n=1 Tax=Rosa chinensis TaxID=74649 RepID=A0A2P6RZW1_ROSCH|nr:hypothetical protein RchiOBHm_Chr2g0150461 [Rosa chinensis]
MWFCIKIFSCHSQPRVIFYLLAIIVHVLCIGLYVLRYHAKKKAEEAYTETDFYRGINVNIRSHMIVDMSTKADSVVNRNTLLQFQIDKESTMVVFSL